MKAVNVDEVLKILHRYGKYIFVTDEKKYSDMVDEIANLKALEQELCGDCISRRAVLNLFPSNNYGWEAALIKSKIEKMSPVTPQEPVIDKLRAEIEQLPTSRCTETCRININADDFKENVLAIFDKYKAESEK